MSDDPSDGHREAGASPPPGSEPSSAKGEREVGGLPSAPPCPFCEGRRTELMNPFGSHASVSTYWCNDCRSPFELLKWQSGEGHKPRIVRP